MDNRLLSGIEIVNNSDDNIVTPFAIPDYKEIKSGKINNSEFLYFDIKAPREDADKLSIAVYSGRNLLFNERLRLSDFANGIYRWKWDGYNNQDIFDSKRLKKAPITIEFKSTKDGVTSTSKKELRAKHAEQDWLDIIINRKMKTIEIELRVNLKDGGSHGTGELPPQDAQNDPVYQRLPQNSPLKNKHQQVKGFVALKHMVLSGLQRYWSRTIALQGNSIYRLKVNPVDTKKNAMDDIKLVYNTNRSWERSSNPGSVRGLYSLFGNFVPERVVYNVGWIEYPTGWVYLRPITADTQFSETASHEIGHEILSAYGGDAYSYSHRGTSTIVTQKAKKVAQGGANYPATGDIDLMKYHNGTTNNYYSRVIASEVDVKSLIWLSRVKFND